MKKNLIFAAAILLLAGVFALLLLFLRDTGGQALVSIAGAQSYTISLEKDGIHKFGTAEGARLPVTLEVQAGKIRFINSGCPDHVCEGFGWLRYTTDSAVCLPAGVVVSVERTAQP